MRNQPIQTALVTGGASGMGRASAVTLANLGIRVFIADLDLDEAQDAVDEIRAKGGRADAFLVDVADSETVRELFAGIRELAGGLDLLVHAAAVMGPTAFLEDITDEVWRDLMSVNLDGTFFCCRETVRLMKETGGGRIVLFSSVAALQPTPGAIGYSAAKGGVNMLAKSLAAEVAKHNIRVNVIAPGYVETPMIGGLPEGFRDYVLKRTPLRRLGRTDEIAALVAFLASEQSDFFTGQVISPNGGMVI